jgi:hypothetical protein
MRTNVTLTATDVTTKRDRQGGGPRESFSGPPRPLDFARQHLTTLYTAAIMICGISGCLGIALVPANLACDLASG